MMTWTSEMSGRASSGMCPMDQIPAITRRNVPVNTKKRLCAHHSMIQLITLHSSCSVHRELLARDHSAVLTGNDRNLPSPARAQLALAFIKAVALVGEIDAGLHRCHSHGGHRCHE